MFSLRMATAEDLVAVVRVHEAAFKGFFMTRLGHPFLYRYYETVMKYPEGILIVAEDSERVVVGFVAGFCSPSAFYRTLRSRRWSLACAILPTILQTPSTLTRILTNFLWVRRRVQAGLDREWCELSSIGIAPEAAGMGVGRGLTKAFCAKAGEMGARHVYLTTDAVENKEVNRFYQSMGFHLAETFDVGRGRLMNKYVVSLVVLANGRERVGG